MTPKLFRLSAAAGLLCATTLPALAESSVSSAASQGVSTSVGSLSTSIGQSSDSSRGNQVAAGEYRIVEVAAAPDRAETARLKLQALADPGAEGEFYLYMPVAALDQSHLAVGHRVTAREHSYGLEFARSDTRQAFFLVLHDAWYRELQTKVVAL